MCFWQVAECRNRKLNLKRELRIACHVPAHSAQHSNGSALRFASAIQRVSQAELEGAAGGAGEWSRWLFVGQLPSVTSPALAFEPARPLRCLFDALPLHSAGVSACHRVRTEVEVGSQSCTFIQTVFSFTITDTRACDGQWVVVALYRCTYSYPPPRLLLCVCAVTMRAVGFGGGRRVLKYSNVSGNSELLFTQLVVSRKRVYAASLFRRVYEEIGFWYVRYWKNLIDCSFDVCETGILTR